MGILDGFKGKVGTVVGAFWKGKKVMRGYNEFAANPRTRSQRLNRARFGTLMTMEPAFMPILRVGLGILADKRSNTEGNNFVNLNWRAVTATTPEEVSVNYSTLKVSKGNLPQVNFHTPDFETEGEVSVTFDSAMGATYAGEDDKVYLFAYQPDLNQSAMGRPVLRQTGSISLAVPSTWSGMKVHLYGVVVGKSDTYDPLTPELGENNFGKVSDTVYVGTGDIA